jgi:hypothetical protein
LRVSYADAVDDDADNVESIVFNMFTNVRKWWQRNSSHFADKHHKEEPQFYQKQFHAFAKVNFGQDVTTTDVIKYFFEYDGVK